MISVKKTTLSENKTRKINNKSKKHKNNTFDGFRCFKIMILSFEVFLLFCSTLVSLSACVCVSLSLYIYISNKIQSGTDYSCIKYMRSFITMYGSARCMAIVLFLLQIYIIKLTYRAYTM